MFIRESLKKNTNGLLEYIWKQMCKGKQISKCKVTKVGKKGIVSHDYLIFKCIHLPNVLKKSNTISACEFIRNFVSELSRYKNQLCGQNWVKGNKTTMGNCILMDKE